MNGGRTTAPQLAAYVLDDPPAVIILPALALYWLLNALSAGGEELWRRRYRLSETSATLLVVSAAFTVWAGFAVLDLDLEVAPRGQDVPGVGAHARPAVRARDQAVAHELPERAVEVPRFQLHLPVGPLPDAPRHRIAMQRPVEEREEDVEVVGLQGKEALHPRTVRHGVASRFNNVTP